MNKQQIKTNAFGVLKGNVLSVAVALNFEYSNEIPKGLIPSPNFISGNGLPVGAITPINTFYDETTGVYWFDLKVNPITGPIVYGFETIGTIGDEVYPIRFTVDISGETKAVVSDIQFNKNVLQYNVGAKEGNVLRHRLTPFATRGITRVDEGVGKDNTAAYGFGTNIDNTKEQIFAVIGSIDIDKVRHNYMVKVATGIVSGGLEIKQKDANTLHAKVVMDKAGKYDVTYPISYVGDGINGIANIVDNLTVEGKTLSFDIPITAITKQNRLKVEVVINKDGKPVFLETMVPVYLWNDNQTDYSIVLVSDVLVKDTRTLTFQANWKNSQPINKLGLLLPNTAVNEVSFRDEGNGVYTIVNKVDLQGGIKKDFILNGQWDLTHYGVEKQTPFKYVKTSGDDVLPIKDVGITGYISPGDGLLNLTMAFRANNGDILDNVKVNSIRIVGKEFDSVFLKENTYDVNTGICSVSLANVPELPYPGKAIIAGITGVVKQGDETHKFTIQKKVYIPVDYAVHVSPPSYGFIIESSGPVLVASWDLKGNDGKYPKSINITSVKLNNVSPSFGSVNKQYYSTTGTLIVKVPCMPNYKETLSLAIAGSPSGLSSFLNFAPVFATYKDPGSVHNVSNELVEGIGNSYQLISKFDINGFSDEVVKEISMDNAKWVNQLKVEPVVSYHLYDNKTGILTVTTNLKEKPKEHLITNTVLFEGVTLLVRIHYKA